MLNVARTTAKNEIRRRAPWLFVGLVAGVVMVLIGRNFEETLSKKIELVFFMPVIVYMSDSIGTETLALFVRELALRRLSLKKLLLREVYVGIFLGLVTGIPMGLFSYIWLKDLGLAMALAITMTINGLVSVLIGMLTPMIFAKLKRDPAVGSDEITTAFSDNISMLIYLAIALVILF